MHTFSNDKPIIGMVHLEPLPDSPGYRSMDEVEESAVTDAVRLADGGVDGLLVENYGDRPFKKEISSLTLSALTSVLKEVQNEVDIPMGLNVLRNDWRAALSISNVLDLSYVRINVFIGVTHTPAGTIEGEAPDIQRYKTKNNIGSSIWADIDVKHGRSVYPKDPGEGALEASERGLADALILSGKRTGKPPSVKDLETVADAVDEPILIGSGLNYQNMEELLQKADGAIVGSHFKKGGKTRNQVKPGRVERLIEKRDDYLD